MDIPQVPTPPGEKTNSFFLAFITAVWVVALELAIRYHTIGLYIAMGMAVLIIVWALVQWRRRLMTNVAGVATFMIAVTTISAISFAPGPWPQHVVVAVSAGLLWLVGQQRQRPHDDLRRRTMAFTTAVLIWFSWYSLLSASVYLNINVLWLVPVAALMTTAAALVGWLETDLTLRQVRWGLLATAWFGAELFAVTWWLPTAILVSSTVATTVVALMVQAARHLWKGHWEPGRSRRYVAVGATVVLIVLATARWI